MDIAQLAADKAALNGRLREMQHATRACQRRCRGLQKTKAKQQRRAETVAFALFVLSTPDTCASKAYLQSTLGLSLSSCAEVCDRLHARFTHADAEELAAIRARTGGVDRFSMTAAQRFQREFLLFQWVCIENEDKGLAPGSGLLLRRLRFQDAVLPAPGAAPRPAAKAGEVKWTQRFRFRWRLLRGSFHARDRVPVQQLRRKAGQRVAALRRARRA